jgi:hypothetical protein
VTAEVNQILGDVGEFAPVTVEELLHVDPEEGGDIDDE